MATVFSHMIAHIYLRHLDPRTMFADGEVTERYFLMTSFDIDQSYHQWSKILGHPALQANIHYWITLFLTFGHAGHFVPSLYWSGINSLR